MKKYMLLLVAAMFLVACGSGGSEEETVESEKVEKVESKSKGNSDEIYFKDNVVKIEDVQIKITDVKILEEDSEGYEFDSDKVIAFWYEATNFTDNDIDPGMAWIAIFTAIQDNDPNAINELSVDSLPDHEHLDSQSQTIKKDGTVESSIAYSLDDDETPVTLVATQGIGGDEIGKKEYEIK